MPKLLFTTLIVLGTVMVLSCSNNIESTGGTGTETVNTFARLPDGTPAAGATARIVAARRWIDSISSGSSPVLGETIADKHGHLVLDFQQPDEQINLQIDHANGALLIPLPAEPRTKADTVYLRHPTSLSGKVAAASEKPAQVHLAGTDYTSPITEAGIFSFGNIAPGSYAVVSTGGATPGALLGCSNALSLTEGTATTGYELTTSDRILIDNFESGVGPTSLGRIFPVLGWYVLSDSLYYLWNTVEDRWEFKPSTPIGNSPIYYDSIASPGNKAFSFSTKLDPVSLRANAVAGILLTPLSSSKQGIDLSAMTGFSIRASGKGILRVRFESQRLDKESNTVSNYSYPLVLSDSWREYNIPVDSLRILNQVLIPSKYPWKEESKNILRLEFEFSTSENRRNDSLYCTLDDFYLEGVSIAAFMVH
jgi:hypothetical protein